MIVQEIMTQNPRHVETTSSIRRAISLMQEFDIRHLPVLEEGELVGIISDRDLRGVILNNDGTSDYLDTKVSLIMQANPVTVDQDADASEAIELIVENKIGALPVVDSHTGKLKGILSYIDILQAISTTDDDEMKLSS